MSNVESSKEHKSCHPKDKEVLTIIRELFLEVGGTLYLRELDNYDVIPMDRDATTDGSFQLEFDYGNPCRLYTPRGKYVVTGNCILMNPAELYERLKEKFKFEIIKPKRDDNQTSEHDFNSEFSGPLVRLTVEETPAPTEKGMLDRIEKFFRRVKR